MGVFCFVLYPLWPLNTSDTVFRGLELAQILIYSYKTEIINGCSDFVQVSLLEYTEQCGPLKETLRNIEARKQEKEDILRLDQEMKLLVSHPPIFPVISSHFMSRT